MKKAERDWAVAQFKAQRRTIDLIMERVRKRLAAQATAKGRKPRQAKAAK